MSVRREIRGLLADQLVAWAFALDPERFAELPCERDPDPEPLAMKLRYSERRLLGILTNIAHNDGMTDDARQVAHDMIAVIERLGRTRASRDRLEQTA